MLPTSKRVAFSIGLVLGALIGAGAMLIVNAMPRQVPAPSMAPEPVAMAAATLLEPWAGYEESTVDNIKWSLRALSLTEREAVRTYEKQRETGPRRGIINVLNALEEERVNGNA